MTSSLSIEDKKFIITWCFLGNFRHKDLQKSKIFRTTLAVSKWNQRKVAWPTGQKLTLINLKANLIASTTTILNSSEISDMKDEICFIRRSTLLSLPVYSAKEYTNSSITLQSLLIFSVITVYMHRFVTNILSFWIYSSTSTI